MVGRLCLEVGEGLQEKIELGKDGEEGKGQTTQKQTRRGTERERKPSFPHTNLVHVWRTVTILAVMAKGSR